MKLALCVIVDNDKRLPELKTLLESTHDVFNSVHITANKKPHTKIRAWCKKNTYDFTYKEWNDDFSEQRNFNFSQVPEDTDYIVWADSDDVIVNPEVLLDVARLAKKKDHKCVFFEYWYGCDFDGTPSIETLVEKELTQNRERMIKPGTMVWKKRIHETPVPIDDLTFNYTQVKYNKTTPIAWLHLGADRNIAPEKLHKRMKRNQRLLELELQDEREKGEADPRTILYLMKVYAESSDKKELEECLLMGQEYLEKSGWDQERGICYMLMARCLGELERHKEAIDMLHGALKEYPYSPLLYLHLARAYFNAGNYRSMKHWMDIGLGMDIEDVNGGMKNIAEMKMLSAELLLKYNLHGKRDIRRAYKAAKLLNKVNPSENNKQNEDFLREQKELDEASEHVHKFMNYLRDIQEESRIPQVVESMPENMRKLPFAYKYYNRYKTPKTWKSNEIAYYATFGQPHFEKWDGHSVNKGIGGSETAVIRLSEEWVRKGYKVVVYGDPTEPIVVNGVVYLPHYLFNPRDHFNIFIQWRNASMAEKINCKKFLVDMHDMYHESSFTGRLDQIDKIMVKSKYHRGLAENIENSKFEIISNGI